MAGIKYDELPEGPVDARDCLRFVADEEIGSEKIESKAVGLAYYLCHDLPTVLREIASHLATPEETGNASDARSRLELGPSLEPAPNQLAAEEDALQKLELYDATYPSDTFRVLEAARVGDAATIAIFLNDLARLAEDLGRNLDPEGRTELRLTLGQRKAGRLANPFPRFLKEMRIKRAIRRLAPQYEKTEALIAAVMEEKDPTISRSEVFKIYKSMKNKD